LALDPSVQAQAVARTVHLVRWLKPGEHLRAGIFRPARGGRVEVDSGAPPAVAELPGGLFARLDVVLLAAELGSGDEGERAQRRYAHRPDEVEVADGLDEGKAPGIERRGTRGSHRRVVRVLHEEVERVAPLCHAEI